jgi:hypothetical protein
MARDAPDERSILPGTAQEEQNRRESLYQKSYWMKAVVTIPNERSGMRYLHELVPGRTIRQK